MRIAAMTITAVLAPVTAAISNAQLVWPPTGGFAPTEAERATILSAAARAGLTDPRVVKLDYPQFGCRGVSLHGEQHYEGFRRTWRWVFVEDDTRADDCVRSRFSSNWSVSVVEEATEWLVAQGHVRVWFQPVEYYTGDGRFHPITYEQARRVVLAFINGRVADRRRRREYPESDAPLPSGPRAARITAVSNWSGGWQVTADGCDFSVALRGGQFVVASSGYPID